MCGIAGIIRFKGPKLTETRDKRILKKMGQRLRFRGPDDEALHFNSDVAFLFRRLSIIDIEGGRQPFEDKRLLAMCNGEIYNYEDLKKKSDYPYQSKSDCEVILPLYEEKGKDFLKSLNGMFAIALWDKKRSQVILARDRLGIKPLFYAITKKGHLVFASEIKALLAHPDISAELDWEENLTRRIKLLDFSKPLNSGFKNIQMLQSGSRLIIDLKKETSHEERWWELQFKTKENDSRSEHEVIQGYKDLLQESVHMQLMSDVEVGLTLSGGIDSVAIAALASEVKPIETFTVLNLSTFTTGDAENAFKAAELFKLSNHQLYFPWQNETISADLFKEINWACEMPITPEQIFKFGLYKKIKSDFPLVKTLLMGQGSDEFNGGYCHIYLEEQLPEVLTEQHTWKLFMETMSKMKKEGRLFQKDPYMMSFASSINNKFVDRFASYPDMDPWNFYQKFYQRSIDDYNLWHEDRMAAANQLENRVPFLDHRIVEYLAKVPKKLRPKLFWEKRILRNAMKKVLPEALYNRKKVPFYMGGSERYAYRMLYDLIARNHSALLKEAILDNPFAKDVLDIDFVRDGFKRIPENPSYTGTEFFVELVSLGLWSLWVKEKKEIEPTVSNLDWYPIKNWDNQVKDIQQMMGEVTSQINPESILRFAEGRLLVVSPTNQRVYIARDFVMEFELDSETKKNYISVLSHLNGKTSLEGILEKVGTHFESILPDLEEGLEYGVLEIVKTDGVYSK